MNAKTMLEAKSVRAGLIAWSALALAGCGYVKRDDLTAQLADLRQEMQGEIQEGDERVATDLGARIDEVDTRLDQVAAELDRLGATFETTVQRFESALRFNAPVFFGFDESDVRSEDQEVLDRFASVIREYYPDAMITAEGFTDPAGNAEYNKRLGQKRAESVVSYLASQGLDANRLRAVSYGEQSERLMDGARGPGETGGKNRRVVLVVEGTASDAELPQAPVTDGAT